MSTPPWHGEALTLLNSGGRSLGAEEARRLSAGLSMVELDDRFDPRLHRMISVFVRTLTEKDGELQKNVINRHNR